MITELRIQGFKSWEDTGMIKLAPLTGLFGPNSSGKTAILQLLLMLKQTAESADRQRVLHTGDERTYVDLGTFYDVVHTHDVQRTLSYSIKWKLPTKLRVSVPETEPESELSPVHLTIEAICFGAKIDGAQRPEVLEFTYEFQSDGRSYKYGMRRPKKEYEVIHEGLQLKRPRGRPLHFPPPVRSYGFPDEVGAYYTNAGWLADLVLSFEQLLSASTTSGRCATIHAGATSGLVTALKMLDDAVNSRFPPLSRRAQDRKSGSEKESYVLSSKWSRTGYASLA